MWHGFMDHVWSAPDKASFSGDRRAASLFYQLSIASHKVNIIQWNHLVKRSDQNERQKKKESSCGRASSRCCNAHVVILCCYSFYLSFNFLLHPKGNKSISCLLHFCSKFQSSVSKEENQHLQTRRRRAEEQLSKRQFSSAFSMLLFHVSTFTPTWSWSTSSTEELQAMSTVTPSTIVTMGNT